MGGEGGGGNMSLISYSRFDEDFLLVGRLGREHMSACV